MASNRQYGWTFGNVVWALFVAGCVFICALILRILATSAGCSPAGSTTKFVLSYVQDHPWGDPLGCTAPNVFGSLFQVAWLSRSGTFFNIGEEFLGPEFAITYSAGILVFAVMVSFAVIRWDWKTSADATALAVVWLAALYEVLPRMFGAGVGSAELIIVGSQIALTDFAFLWGSIWLMLRAAAESKA